VGRLRTQAKYFVNVRLVALLLESVSKAGSKIVEKYGSIRMTQGQKLQRSLIELNGLIEVRHDTLVQGSVMKAECKIVQRQGSI
jgi:hypothetical protein